MNDIDEQLQREIALLDYEIVRMRAEQGPWNEIKQAELRAAHRATRFSKAYLSGDMPPHKPPSDNKTQLAAQCEDALLTPLDFVTLMMFKAVLSCTE